MLRDRKVVETTTYHMTPLEVKCAIRDWADGRASMPGGYSAFVPDDAAIEITEDGGAEITAHVSDVTEEKSDGNEK